MPERGYILSALVGAMALFCASTGLTREFGEGRVMFGTSGKSCGTWIQLRPAGPLKDEVPAEFGALLMWVLGFISGANADPSRPDVLLKSDVDGLITWIDTYCRANPLQGIPQAATHLVIELRSKRRR